MPQTISISLDREERSEKMRADLAKRSTGLMRFLPRRTYENFLLHPRAIEAVLNGASGVAPVSSDIIRLWIEEHRTKIEYFAKTATPSDRSEGEWIKNIDAPKLLSHLFNELTDHTVDFKSRKVEYSIAFTQWLIENDREYVQELVDYVKTLLES